MKRPMVAAASAALALAALLAAQAHNKPRPFREYPPMEGMDSQAPLPPNHDRPAELVLGRLMYPSSGGRGGRGGGFGGFGGGNWVNGGTNWTVDYPKGDRAFALAIARLTRVDVRPVEQPVNPDDGDDIYYWPYLHVGMPTSWNLTEGQARKVREYLLRGGFLICDSFFGTQEWAGFEKGMLQIFPDRGIEDLPADDSVFHSIFDIREKYQVGNYRSMLRNGQIYRADGSVPTWRGIRDDKGRVMVVINFNNDLGDSWQLADVPAYPERFSHLGLRLGISYVLYAMTH